MICSTARKGRGWHGSALARDSFVSYLCIDRFGNAHHDVEALDVSLSIPGSSFTSQFAFADVSQVELNGRDHNLFLNTGCRNEHIRPGTNGLNYYDQVIPSLDAISCAASSARAACATQLASYQDQPGRKEYLLQELELIGQIQSLADAGRRADLQQLLRGLREEVFSPSFVDSLAQRLPVETPNAE